MDATIPHVFAESESDKRKRNGAIYLTLYGEKLLENFVRR